MRPNIYLEDPGPLNVVNYRLTLQRSKCQELRCD
jgi:hypothetical protein